MDISLPAEVIFHLGPIAVTNSLFSTWLLILILLVGSFFFRRTFRRLPGRLQSAIELIYSWLYDSAKTMIGRDEVTKAVFPYLITLFLFILFSNWLGLLPGMGSIGIHELKDGKDVLVPIFRAPTSDMNTVAALAVLTVAYIQYLGFKYAGVKVYLGKFFNIHDPIMAYVGFLELLSEFTRILSFTFRLFGNVFSGEVLIAVIFYLTMNLVPFIPIIPLPFFMLEMFVGGIQAFVFVFLTMVFTALAVAGHGDHSEQKEHVDPKSLRQLDQISYPVITP
jgi:F-type H+-transporting ATPase subunit a